MIDIKEIWYIVESEEALYKDKTLELKPELLEENKKKIRNYYEGFGYAFAGDFQEGIALVYNKKGRCLFIDREGNEIFSLPPRYMATSGFCQSLVLVCDGDKFGYINQKGEKVIPFVYEEANDFHEGLAAVKRGNKWGYINQKGEEVIPFIYDNAHNFHEGLAAIKKGNKWGYINQKGEEVIPFIYDEVEDFHCGLTAVMRNIQWHYINMQGEIVFSLEPGLDDAKNFHESLVAVVQPKNNKWGYLNQKGEEVIPFIYDDVRDFHEGLATVKRGNRWGYINQKGEEVIPFVYDEVRDFHEGLAAVQQNSRWSYINKLGQTVISLDYAIDCPCEFSEGLAAILNYDKCIYINREGKNLTSEVKAAKMIDTLVSLTKTFSGLYYDLETEKVIVGTVKKGIVITGKNGQQIIDDDLNVDDIIIKGQQIIDTTLNDGSSIASEEQPKPHNKVKSLKPSNDDFYR